MADEIGQQDPMFKQLNPYAQAGIQTGADILGGVVNNLFAERNAKRAYERQVAFWKMQNRYNDPSQQMIRFKRAGINPHAFYQKGVNQVTSQAAPSIQKAQTFGINPQLVQSMATAQSINESKSREDLNKSNTDLTKEKTTRQAIDNYVASFPLNFTQRGGQQAMVIGDSGNKYTSPQAYKAWLNNDESFPPAIENMFFNRLRNGYETTSSLEKKRILQAERVLKQAGYTWNDDLAVRIGIMIADKDPNIDTRTIQGASAVWNIVQSLLPTLGRFTGRAGQRGYTKPQYTERSVYNREGKYMGGSTTTIKN